MTTEDIVQGNSNPKSWDTDKLGTQSFRMWYSKVVIALYKKVVTPFLTAALQYLGMKI